MTGSFLVGALLIVASVSMDIVPLFFRNVEGYEENRREGLEGEKDSKVQKLLSTGRYRDLMNRQTGLVFKE